MVLELLGAAPLVSTSRISYVECNAAFARGGRDGRLTRTQASSAVSAFASRWPDLVVVELDGAVTERAGRIAYDDTLRAGDAIHLASAEAVAGGSPAETRFACWDQRLWGAAATRGFSMVPESRPG